MSHAWNTTFEDVDTVLQSHRINICHERLVEIVKILNADKIEDAALRGDEFVEQATYAYGEIEDQLVEAGIIPKNVQRIFS
jgi:hypothetical protein